MVRKLLTTGEVFCRHNTPKRKWSTSLKIYYLKPGRMCNKKVGEYKDGKFQANKNYGSGIMEFRCKKHKEDGTK